MMAYRAEHRHARLDGPGDQEARRSAKLAKFSPKIGYPKSWRDYSALVIKPRRPGRQRHARARVRVPSASLAKLGKPVDRDEWEHDAADASTPTTTPALNEIVFPAAILQPPFFDPEADDAVNYGAIGAVIGHEISHGFDDQGSQYDGDGNLRDWWTAEPTASASRPRPRQLVAQYTAYEPVPGYKVNGELTLGENIADNSGLAIAYKAYQLLARAASRRR